MTKLIDKAKYTKKKPEIYTLSDFLDKVVEDPSLNATAAERLLKAIGEPIKIDTSKDPKLNRLFRGKTICKYKPFEDMHGMEDVVQSIVNYLKHNMQCLEESKQILYLLGPVGGGKSSISEKLKALMEQEPIYVLVDEEGHMSPVLEHPLGLFKGQKDIEDKVQIRTIMSPWARKRLDEYEGDFNRFSVHKIYPDQIRQLAISKTEPGDENNQDISSLVGKIDIRKLEKFPQDDPDAYSYSGALCLSNQGILEFVEMFKSPLKVLNPLLTATQERNFKGTEAIGNIPFDGIILAHSNFSEWDSFKNNKQNEAFIDRIYTIEVPYNLRLDEEIKIYEGFINRSKVKNAPIAPYTLELLAKFNVLSRLEITDSNMNIESKLKAYNGERADEDDKRAKTYQEYKDLSSKNEGTTGISTRLAFKMLAQVFNYDPDEISADPINLFQVIHETLNKERYPEQEYGIYMQFLDKFLKHDYKEKLKNMLQEAYVESYTEFGQAIFDKYILYADHWMRNEEFRDKETGEMYSREDLNDFLEQIEKKAGKSNPKEFRQDVVNMSLRYSAYHKGKKLDWKTDKDISDVIKAQIDIQQDQIFASLSKKGKGSKEDKLAYERVLEALLEKGYTEKQVRRNIDWYNKVK